VDFGMNLQVAVDAPTFHTAHFPSSFHPHGAEPGALYLEGRIPGETVSSLQKKGHAVRVGGDWGHGRVLGIRFDADSGTISGAATARMETGYAIGW
jgi:gamma-glutamyltranspeptidase/glutathione hydrolase